MSFYRWMQRREHGLPGQYGDEDFLQRRVYKSMGEFHQWNNQIDQQCAVFNFEFNSQGNILVAACEKKTILLFDALTTKNTCRIAEAHADNVNCIKFLDDHIFASCSDDTTVALWDLRYLKLKLRSLHGHSNWVKNIEYSHKDHLLVTSGFDGSIFTWDINSHTEQGLIYQKVFHTSGLMRCRISPDNTKMIICTTGGYLMIIHNLDLTTLHKDLCGFRPGIYRLMQSGHQYIPQAAKFDHVFSKKQKKNRVEFVSDFPEMNDAEVILALQIHPQGHSFLSRNISYDEMTEWSCVHDLKENPGDITDPMRETNMKRKRKLVSESDDDDHHRSRNNSYDGGNMDDLMMLAINRRHHRNQHLRATGRGSSSTSTETTPSAAAAATAVADNSSGVNIQPASRTESFVPDIWAAEVTVQERAIRQNRARSCNSVTGYSFVYAISSGVLPAGALTTSRAHNSRSGANAIRGAADRERSRERRNSATNANRTSTDGAALSSTSSADSSSSSSSSSTSSNNSPPHLPFDRRIRMPSIISPLRNRERIFENPKKLMYFIQESNIGKGFIKEPCFSSDGRIICSPYDNGVRLLAFDENCSEYPHQRSHYSNPRHLHVLKEITSHWDIVLSSKFSPREPLLVTGCRAGNIVWHHPIL